MPFVTDEIVTAARLNLATTIGYGQNTDSRTFTNTGLLDLGSLTGGAGTVADVTVSVTTGTVALVMAQAFLANSTLGATVALAYKVSGATTIAGTVVLTHESGAANDLQEGGGFRVEAALNAGVNVFELQAQVSAGTGDIRRPRLVVMPILG